MKEADIQYKQLYAVEPYEGQGRELLCMVVETKMPPKAGASRSRMYRCRMHGDSNASPQFIDASKILMSWADYEKTPEYAERHLETVTQALDASVHQAKQNWARTLESYVIAATPKSKNGQTVVGVRLLGRTDTVEDLVDTVMGGSVHTDIGAIVRLGQLPIPDTAPVQAAMDHRQETLASLTRQVLPHREARLLAGMREARAANVDGRWVNGSRIALENYVDDLALTGIEGPHELLVELSKAFPTEPWLKELTQQPQFHYLIPYLDFDPI